MDSGLPVKDVGLSVDTGLSYSEDDYQGNAMLSFALYRCGKAKDLACFNTFQQVSV